MGLLSVWIFFDICVVVGWILVSPMYETKLKGPEDDVLPNIEDYNKQVLDGFAFYQCADDDNSKLFQGAFILSHVTLMGTGVFYTLKLRGVQSKLAEKHVIGNIVQQTAVLTVLCTIILLPSSGVPVDVQNLFMFSCVMIATVSANLQMVISKVKQGLNSEVTADDFRISENGGVHGRDTDMVRGVSSTNRSSTERSRGGGKSPSGKPSGVYRGGGKAGVGFQSTFKKKGEGGEGGEGGGEGKEPPRSLEGNIEMGSIPEWGPEEGESGVFNQSNPMREAVGHGRRG